MIQVEQTKGVDYYDLSAGNCYAACIASILEVSINEVPSPTIEEMADLNAWQQYTQRLHYDFFDKYGLYVVSVRIPQNDWVPLGYSIVCLEHLDGPHCLVALNGEIIWDPHPDRDERCYGGTIDWVMIIPTDPSRFVFMQKMQDFI